MSESLSRLFGQEGFGMQWIIIVLFFLFLAFGESWVDIDVCAWIPFLIVILIIMGMDGIGDC